MLIEAFLALTAQTDPALRRMGLVGDAVALWSRATRRRRYWAPHEARSHAVITRALEGLDRYRTALVLGSGLLRDVPVDALARRFDRVVLVDAVHLWPARRHANRVGAERRVIDLTGLAAGLTGVRGPAGPHVVPPFDPLDDLKADPTIDLVVSACLLSQLPYAPQRWRERHPSSPVALPGSAALPGPAAIVARHLADLSAFAGRICLVTDVAFDAVRRDGSREATTDLLHGVALPPPDDAWDWQVAPRGEIDRHLSYVHKVHGYCDLPHITPSKDDLRILP